MCTTIKLPSIDQHKRLNLISNVRISERKQGWNIVSVCMWEGVRGEWRRGRKGKNEGSCSPGAQGLQSPARLLWEEGHLLGRMGLA